METSQALEPAVLILAWDSEEDSLSPYYKLVTLPGAALREETEAQAVPFPRNASL